MEHIDINSNVSVSRRINELEARAAGIAGELAHLDRYPRSEGIQRRVSGLRRQLAQSREELAGLCLARIRSNQR